MATTKQFLDPTQNPTKILIEMRRVRYMYYKTVLINPIYVTCLLIFFSVGKNSCLFLFFCVWPHQELSGLWCIMPCKFFFFLILNLEAWNIFDINIYYKYKYKIDLPLNILYTLSQIYFIISFHTVLKQQNWNPIKLWKWSFFLTMVLDQRPILRGGAWTSGCQQVARCDMWRALWSRVSERDKHKNGCQTGTVEIRGGLHACHQGL